MHSAYQRINNLSALFSSCVLVLLGAIALSSFLFSATPQGELGVLSVKVYPGKKTAGHRAQLPREFAFVRFNISADLTPLFNWNTKQLFVYLGAEYTNAQNVTSDVVIWDRIVRRKEDGVLRVSGKNKYVFKEVSSSFRGAEPAQYVLKYNVMPHVGALVYGEAARSAQVPFPNAQERVV